MPLTARADTGVDLLGGWLEKAVAPWPRGRRTPAATGGLRFAFYGRISTSEYQDRFSSLRWQRDCANELVAGHGSVVAEFFDVEELRRQDWAVRPEASALLETVADVGRGFDAVVVGEYERAFSGGQLMALLPVFERHGVRLWLPELGGPVDTNDPMHQALITLLGHQSQREVLRALFRVAAAMRVQAREQGRHLGGRPPYGYQLVDAGPHPIEAHARWGRRLHRLDPDPVTARHVRWIFAQRLAGHSAASIARALNEKGGRVGLQPVETHGFLGPDPLIKSWIRRLTGGVGLLRRIPFLHVRSVAHRCGVPRAGAGCQNARALLGRAQVDCGL